MHRETVSTGSSDNCCMNICKSCQATLSADMLCSRKGWCKPCNLKYHRDRYARLKADPCGVVECSRTCTTCGIFKSVQEMVKGKLRCKACRRVADAAYEHANREAITKRKRERKQADPERALELDRASRARNAEKITERQRRYAEKNREKLKRQRREKYLKDPSVEIERALARLLKRRAATPPWADRSAIRAIYLRAQQLRLQGDDVEVDHCIPLQGEVVSGLHVESNLVIKKRAINRRKRNKFTVNLDWVLINGKLDVEL